MATFTMELWEMMKSYDDIGLNHYPIFDESYRLTLNEKIQNNFLTQEIGYESPMRFRTALRNKMALIMPLYNQRYESELIKIDPLRTISIKNVVTQQNNGTQTGVNEEQTNGRVFNEARAVDSDTPQSILMEDGDYASGIADSISEAGTENTGSSENKLDSSMDSQGSTETEGYNGSQSELLLIYRQTLINVDQEIIEDIESANLFMQLWSSGDSFTTTQNGYFNNVNSRYYPNYPRF